MTTMLLEEVAKGGLHKFPLGHVVATPGAMAIIEKDPALFGSLLARHVVGDWGDVCDDDAASNDLALSCDARVMSVYKTELGTVWIITEADRHATTFLLPEEY